MFLHSSTELRESKDEGLFCPESFIAVKEEDLFPPTHRVARTNNVARLEGGGGLGSLSVE